MMFVTASNALTANPMEINYYKEYSQAMGRDMEFKTYGTQGTPILVFPSQDGRFYDYENFGMIDVLSPWIESGKARVICCDGIDWETWSNFGGDPRQRIEQHERWFHYLVDELIPRVRQRDDELFLATGCSMGGFHAGNIFFRRPDLFMGVVALSGLYHAGYGFGGYTDELTYANSPQDFIPQMPLDHPWLQMYRQKKIVLCVGQGKWEEELLDSTRQMKRILEEKQVPAWVDIWGFDVDHDWPWWRKQLTYFMEKILG